jgi:hypothetical protein
VTRGDEGVSGQSGWRAVAAAPVAEATKAVNWLLDTDVICQPAKKNGDSKVVAWLEAEQDRCYTSAVVIAQLAYWVQTKDGWQRPQLQAWLTRLVEALHGRIVDCGLDPAMLSSAKSSASRMLPALRSDRARESPVSSGSQQQDRRSPLLGCEAQALVVLLSSSAVSHARAELPLIRG